MSLSRGITKRRRISKSICEIVERNAEILGAYESGKYSISVLCLKYDMSYSNVYGLISKSFDKVKRLDIQRKQVENNKLRGIKTFPNGATYVYGKYYSKKSDCVVKYRSSWEKKAIVLLEREESVVKYEYETIFIRCDNGRCYVPDFLVTLTDGMKIILEVKPKDLVYSGSNISKIMAAQEYCRNNNMKFVVWTEDNLAPVTDLDFAMFDFCDYL